MDVDSKMIRDESKQKLSLLGDPAAIAQIRSEFGPGVAFCPASAPGFNLFLMCLEVFDMVALADYYVIESVHGVRQRIPLQALRQRHTMMRQSSAGGQSTQSSVAGDELADTMPRNEGSQEGA